MLVGLHTGPQHCTFDELRALWRIADEGGFWWTSVWDHMHPAQADPDGPCFEAVASHAALAALTTRVRVGCLVYYAAYRNAGVLAKVACTLDHISGGRAELGLGAGWHEDEFRAYGIPFLAPAERLAHLEEAIEAVRTLWRDGTATFHGKYVDLDGARCLPGMVQATPRIWVGALQPRALRLAGRAGDGWNTTFLPPDEWGRRSEIVTQGAEEAGRDPGAVMRSVNVGLVLGADDREVDARRARLAEQFGPIASYVESGSLVGTPQQVLDRAGEYAKAGCDLIVVALRAPFDLEQVERFAAEVVPHLG